MSLIQRRINKSNDILNNPEYIIDSIKNLISVPYFNTRNNYRLKEDNKEEWFQVSINEDTDEIVLYIDKDYGYKKLQSVGLTNIIDIDINKWNKLQLSKKIVITSSKNKKRNTQLNIPLVITFNGFTGGGNIDGFSFYIGNDNKNSDLYWLINGKTQVIKNCDFSGSGYSKNSKFFILDEDRFEGKSPTKIFENLLNLRNVRLIDKEVDNEFNILVEYNKIPKVMDLDGNSNKFANNSMVSYGILKNENIGDNPETNNLINFYNDDYYKRKYDLEDYYTNKYGKQYNNLRIIGKYI